MSVYGGPNLVTNGLVYHIDFANTKCYSGSTVTDLSGYGHSTSISNGASGPPTFDSSSGSFLFDGLDDYMYVTPATRFKWTQDGSVGTSTMTIEVWVKVSNDSGWIVSRPWSGNGNYNIQFKNDSFNIRVDNTNPNNVGYPSNIVNPIQWRQVVTWMDSTNMGTYVNGNKNSTSKAHGITSNTITYGDGNVGLTLMTLFPYGGQWAGNTTYSVAGNLAIVKVYNRVLSAAEVEQNFQAHRGRFGI